MTRVALRLMDNAQSAQAAEASWLFQCGLDRFQHGDYEGAVRHFSAALKIDPHNAALYAQRAEAFRLQCDYGRALSDIEKALQIQPSEPAFVVKRASVYLQSGRFATAVADATAALNLDPKHVAAYRVRAAAHAAQGRQELALADWTEVVNNAPDDNEAFYSRGVIRAWRREYSHAVLDFDRTLQQNPYHVRAYLQRGHSRRCLGLHAQAICDYTEVLRHHPTNVLAYAGRGMAYRLQGNSDRALADFNEALSLDADNAQVYYQRGVLYRARGELGRAQADLDEAIRRRSDNWAAFYYRGRILLSLGQPALALLDLTQTIHLNPSLVAAQLGRALTYDRLGRFDDGIEDATHALTLEPNCAAAHLVRGVIQAHKGALDPAVADLSEVIRIDERFALAFHERSMAYALQKNYDRALADCNRWLALEPSNPRAYAHRSGLYHFKGNMQEALADYARALQIDPTCIMSAWNQNLAEAARNATVQRIADYVDGLRTQTPGEPPPPADFEIFVRPGAPASATQTATRKQAIAATKPTAVMPIPPQKSQVEQAVDEAVADLLADKPRQAVRTKPASSMKPDSEEPERAQSETSALTVTCPNCEQPAAVAQNGPGGKLRCTKCKSLFSPWSAASFKSAVTVKKEVKQKAEPRKWQRPLPLVGAMAASLLIVYLCFPASLFGKPNRLRVHPTQGKIEFQGKPVANAAVFLHPVGVKTFDFPRPRATTRADGTFTIGTVGKEDGAPAGEYKLTAEWFETADQARSGRLPRNLLPPRFSRPETSSIIVKIHQGTNQLGPIVLDNQ